jgi:hypothetical protein
MCSKFDALARHGTAGEQPGARRIATEWEYFITQEICRSYQFSRMARGHHHDGCGCIWMARSSKADDKAGGHDFRATKSENLCQTESNRHQERSRSIISYVLEHQCEVRVTRDVGE